MKNLLLIFFIPNWIFLGAQSNFSKSLPVSPDTTDTGLSIVKMEDGYLIGCGSVKKSNNREYANLLKIDWDANPLWTKSYYWEPFQPDIGFSDPVVVRGNRIFMSCQTNSDSADLNLQLFSMNLEGDTLWSKSYPGDFRDLNLSVYNLLDSNLLILGTKGTTDILNVARLIKTDEDGNALWDKTYGSEFGKSQPWNVAQLEDSSLVLASVICHFGSNCALEREAALTKVDKHGNKIWTKTYNESESWNIAWVLPLDEDRLALGWTRDTDDVTINYPYPPVIYFLDSLGNIEYDYMFSTHQERDLMKMHRMSNGDILGAGFTYEFSDGETVGGWLFRMTQEGELLWERRISDRRYSDLFGAFWDAIETPDGGILAVGTIVTNNWLNAEVWLVKLDGDGCMQPGCTADSIFITSTSEIPQDELAYFEISPNPARDFISIHLDPSLNPMHAVLELINLSGRKVKLVELEHSFQELDTSDLGNGIYFARLLFKGRPLSARKVLILR